MGRKKTVEVEAPARELLVTTESAEVVKESCERVGLRRENCILAIKEALLATKKIVNKFGEVVEEEADHEKRLKAAVMGLEIMGDFRNKESAGSTTTYNTVVYQWKKPQC